MPGAARPLGGQVDRPGRRRARRRRREQGRQPIGHRLVEHAGEGRRHPPALRLQRRHAATQAGIALQRRGQRVAALAGELAVGKGHQLVFAPVHGASPSIACSASRARASRLVSVPTGMPSTAAASW